MSANDITIPYPDNNRIDLTIKGKNFFLIIENKVTEEMEQRINKAYAIHYFSGTWF